MDEFEKYLHKPENGQLGEWLKYLDQNEYDMIEFHFNEFAKYKQKKLVEEIDDKFLNKSTMIIKKGEKDKFIIDKQDWNYVINYK